MRKLWLWLNEWITLEGWTYGLALALSLVGFCGGISNGLDLDHVLTLIVEGTPITIENILTNSGRPLHIPAVVVSGCLFCLGHSRGHRLLAEIDETVAKLVKVR